MGGGGGGEGGRERERERENGKLRCEYIHVEGIDEEDYLRYSK